MTDSGYREMMLRTIDGHNLRCIDGAIHGCSICVGYCSYKVHSGFLTSDQVKEHQCIEKGCNYYYSKPYVDRPRRVKVVDSPVLLAAQMATTEMEGLKVIRASQVTNGLWIVYYVAISQYVLLPVETVLSQMFGCRVQLQQIHCDFDAAVSLVMQ